VDAGIYACILVAQQRSENMMKLFIHQLGLKEVAALPLGGPPVASQTHQPRQVASSLSVTASVETELNEELQLFINKMESSFEGLVKKYVQAKRNLKKKHLKMS
jgi:hypothetical protein